MVCYLGSVDERDRERLAIRVDFWDGVFARLNQLHLRSAERTSIVESIGLVVAPVPEDEAAQFRKEREEFYRKVHQIQILQRLGFI